MQVNVDENNTVGIVYNITEYMCVDSGQIYTERGNYINNLRNKKNVFKNLFRIC